MARKKSSIGSKSNVVPMSSPVVVSKWVNEPLPPLHVMLSAHDVAHLIRRPRWVFRGLSLVGKFPKPHRFHGRRIGWRRDEILEWLTRDIASLATPEDEKGEEQAFRQVSLPLGLLC